MPEIEQKLVNWAAEKEYLVHSRKWRQMEHIEDLGGYERNIAIPQGLVVYDFGDTHPPNEVRTDQELEAHLKMNEFIIEHVYWYLTSKPIPQWQSCSPEKLKDKPYLFGAVGDGGDWDYIVLTDRAPYSFDLLWNFREWSEEFLFYDARGGPGYTLKDDSLNNNIDNLIKTLDKILNTSP